MSYRRGRESYSTLVVVFAILVMIISLFVNFSMRGDCLESGGIWIMQSWVCVPGGNNG